MSDKKIKLSFEEAIIKLDEVVKQLENPECPLEKSVELYEEAADLLLFCKEKLDTVQDRVMTIDERLAQMNDDRYTED